MKKYGKYEKLPEGVPAEQPKPKNNLLQTYFTSLLCMVLSVTMFFGTSFAWFTSEVNNVGNEIYIGTLDVELKKQTGTDTWVSLSALKDGANEYRLFDDQIRWEPGYTMMETVKVINEGDLAFKYELSFTDGMLAEGSKESIEAIAGAFEVWSYNHAKGEPTPEKYADISEENDWYRAGTLAEVLAGKPVFTGEMNEAAVFNGQILSTAHTYTIALHMSENATGDGLMGQKISLNVKLVAYQKASEQDAFEGVDYDTVIPVHDAEELIKALKDGGNVLLMNDIELLEDEQITIPAGVTAILDLNGNTLSQSKEQTTAYAMVDNKGNLTITDSSEEGEGKITYVDTATYAADNGYASNTIRNEGTLNVYGGTIENKSSDNVKENGYPHAIDCYQGSVTNIYGGTVKSANYDCIRMFCNSVTEAATVNIYGGNIVNRVTFQNPNNSTNTAGYGRLNISGGTFTTTNGIDANVRLLNFSTDYSNMKATISGGTFDKGVKLQDKASTNIQMNDWLTVTNLRLNEPTDGGIVWTITAKENN